MAKDQEPKPAAEPANENQPATLAGLFKTWNPENVRLHIVERGLELQIQHLETGECHTIPAKCGAGAEAWRLRASQKPARTPAQPAATTKPKA